MSRKGVSIVIAFALTGLLLATVATSGGVNLWNEPQWALPELDIEPIETASDADSDEDAQLDFDRSGSSFELPRWIRIVVTGLVSTALVIGLIAFLVAVWNRRPQLRWRRRTIGRDEFDVLPDVAEAIVEEAAAQRAALLSGAPRNAIVQCWLRLEHDVAAAGLRRPPADTSAEFTERVLAGYSVDSRAIHDLAALYREARFSDHLLDEAARRAALDALERLHRSLADPSDDSAQVDAATEGNR